MKIAPNLATWMEGLVFLLIASILFTIGAGLVEAPVHGLTGFGLDLVGAAFFVGAASALGVAANDFRITATTVVSGVKTFGRKSWGHRPAPTAKARKDAQ
ncbi:hypothetical protein ACLBV5_09800 [Brevundimonas sp. M1A4_2e]